MLRLIRLGRLLRRGRRSTLTGPCLGCCLRGTGGRSCSLLFRRPRLACLLGLDIALLRRTPGPLALLHRPGAGGCRGGFSSRSACLSRSGRSTLAGPWRGYPLRPGGWLACLLGLDIALLRRTPGPLALLHRPGAGGCRGGFSSRSACLSRSGPDSCPLSGSPHLSLLERHFRDRPVHLSGRNNIIRHLRLGYPCPLADVSLTHVLHLLTEDDRVYLPALVNGPFILLDPVHHARVRLLVHRDIRVAVPLSHVGIIVDHRVVDDRSSMVVVDIDVGHPGISIVVHAIEIILADDHGMSGIRIIPDVHVYPAKVGIGHHDRPRASPGIVAVVSLTRRQRHPSHVPVAVNPGDPSRAPGEAHVQKGQSRSGDGRSPVPLITHQDPIPVVMRDVAEGLGGNPRLISVPLGPSTRSERRPSDSHGGRSPEPARPSLIRDLHPTSVFVEGVGVALKGLRQIPGR